jgi:cellulose synthase/poly-beta-1,6-N-acetylglucosamine synthase-like glycosyltransferase
MFSFTLALIGLFLVTPALSMLALTLASLPTKTRPQALKTSPLNMSFAVIVPAHNESKHLTPTLQSIRSQLGPKDRLLVVADNCTDDTANVARAFGAEVLERFDDHLRGKGYALAFGVNHLRLAPPDVVVIVDADCLLSDSALPVLAAECHASQHPVQMLDLMTTNSAQSGLRFRIMEFAMLMKNKVRPLGSFALGQACHLMGTGMALPWQLIESSNLATGHIAEDMKLGIELTLKGKAPRFLSSVHITSPFLEDSSVVKAQKSRWEHGHMAVMAEELPQLLWQAIQQRQTALIVLAMDLMIPPIAFYFMLLSALLLLSGLGAWFFDPLKPMAWVAASGFCSLSLSILIGWWFFGRHLLNVRELLTTPLYALWKLPVYIAFFMKKRSGWKRTDRDKK